MDDEWGDPWADDVKDEGPRHLDLKTSSRNTSSNDIDNATSWISFAGVNSNGWVNESEKPPDETSKVLRQWEELSFGGQQPEHDDEVLEANQSYGTEGLSGSIHRENTPENDPDPRLAKRQQSTPFRVDSLLSASRSAHPHEGLISSRDADMRDIDSGSKEHQSILIIETDDIRKLDDVSTSFTDGGSTIVGSPSSEKQPRPRELSERDISLSNKLFNLPLSEQTFAEPDENIVSSTSTCKAWYRISRMETLRQYNSGETDETYVRVAWQNSRVKREVTKVISKWAAEDKVQGKTLLGGRSGLLFNWDTNAARVQSPTSSKHPSRVQDLGSTLPLSPIDPKLPSRRGSKADSSSSKPLSPTPQFEWSSTTQETTPLPLSRQSGEELPQPNKVLQQNLINGPEDNHSRSVISENINHAANMPMLDPTGCMIEPLNIMNAHSSIKPTNEQKVSLMGWTDDAPTRNLDQSSIQEDEDDWGEMVHSSADGPSKVTPPPSITMDSLPDPSNRGPNMYPGIDLPPNQESSSSSWMITPQTIQQQAPSVAKPRIFPSTHIPSTASSTYNDLSIFERLEFPLIINNSTGNGSQVRISSRISTDITPISSTTEARPGSPTDETVVRSILTGLPNLSYILR